MSLAKEHAQNIIDCCFDAYNEENIDVEKMTDEQAKRFVIEHIEFIIGINGINYLWEVEKNAIEELKLNIDY